MGGYRIEIQSNRGEQERSSSALKTPQRNYVVVQSVQGGLVSWKGVVACEGDE
jgi:hypothetical protein